MHVLRNCGGNGFPLILIAKFTICISSTDFYVSISVTIFYHSVTIFASIDLATTTKIQKNTSFHSKIFRDLRQQRILWIFRYWNFGLQ